MYEETECRIIHRLKKNKEITIVYFGPKEHDYYKKVYLPMLEEFNADAAGRKRKVFFRHNDDQSCADDFEAPRPSIMLYKQWDEKVSIYEGPADAEAFRVWTFNKFAPKLFNMREHADLTLMQGHPYVIFFRGEKDKDTDFAKEYEDAAYEFNGKKQIHFAYSTLD